MKRGREETIREISRLLRGLMDQQRADLLHTTFSPNVPVSAFSAPLSSLEVVVKYLKDSKKRTVNEIAKLLNRTPSTIYTTYTVACEKYPNPLRIQDRSYEIPISIIADRRFSVLEAIVAFLRQTQELTLADIARLLKKNYSTVKTVYARYLKKRRRIR